MVEVDYSFDDDDDDGDDDDDKHNLFRNPQVVYQQEISSSLICRQGKKGTGKNFGSNLFRLIYL